MDKLTRDFYSRCSSYCFKKMSDGRYLALNRKYLPLDRSRADVGGYLEQEDYDKLLETSHEELGITLTTREISLLKHRGDDNMFFLYDDGCSPWNGKKHENAYDKKIRLVPQVKRLA